MNMGKSKLGALAMAGLIFITLSAATPNPDANGKLNVMYERAADDDMQELADAIRDTKIFDEMALGLSETLMLPRDMNVVFRNCGQQNAFYDPGRTEIVMCYELVEMFAETFVIDGASDEEVGENLVGTTMFFFLHELGHGLVHQLDLPITGREEDAVDQLAAMMLLDGGWENDDQGMLLLSGAAIQFGELAAKMGDQEDPAFWGEHSLDVQRMYNMLCMIYGSKPEAYAMFVGPDMLPKERAERCPKEYEQVSRSWRRLLNDHVRPEPETPSAGV
jgi:hypothetical protein